MEEEENEEVEVEVKLELAIKLLSLGDFSTARKYALLSQPSPNPTHPLPEQIIAVSDVLLSSTSTPTDHYSILQLQPHLPDWSTAVRTHFLKLFSLIHPVKDTLPFAGRALHLICEARTLLSNPEKRACFDLELKLKDGLQGTYFAEKVTFWTVCPYCFYMYEYDGVYEGCCLLCQNCRKAFHGAAVEDPPPSPPPPPPMWSGGYGIGEYYYHGVGMFPLRYCLDGGNARVRPSGGSGFL